jgi:hypothetical protein
VAVKKGER